MFFPILCDFYLIFSGVSDKITFSINPIKVISDKNTTLDTPYGKHNTAIINMDSDQLHNFLPVSNSQLQLKHTTNT